MNRFIKMWFSEAIFAVNPCALCVYGDHNFSVLTKLREQERKVFTLYFLTKKTPAACATGAVTLSSGNYRNFLIFIVSLNLKLMYV